MTTICGFLVNKVAMFDGVIIRSQSDANLGISVWSQIMRDRAPFGLDFVVKNLTFFIDSNLSKSSMLFLQTIK